MDTDFTHKTAVIVCHDWMYGPPQELREYFLKHKISKLLFIGHKNQYVKNNNIKASYYEYYFGKKVLRHQTKPLQLPEYLVYLVDSIRTIWWTVTVIHKPVDYFIGIGNLNVFVGILLRMIGRVHRAYYYVIDYVPIRFQNKIMNTIYHSIDKFCALYSDSTWNYANGMIREREKKWKRAFPRQFVVPNGIHIRKGNIIPEGAIHAHELIYMGTLYKQQGLQAVIKSLSLIKKSISDITLVVIGDGPYKQELMDIANIHHVSDCITYLGHIPDPQQMEKRLSYAALGLATYEPNQGFVSYTEPGKVKRYLSCGVPVIMTDINPIARALVQYKCGIVTPYDWKSIANLIVRFMNDKKSRPEYRKNAVQYVSDFEWDTIFDRAFAESQ